ncbi:ANTAR domain-containing protein [Streptomyces sp. NPDC127077]|uniref:ANTAR domain-containing protein n=1 Tax=Streptomyces sp. NPDC127077 TaxID=3347131 RepID=UPI00365DD3E0
MTSTSSTSLEACVAARVRELEGENVQLQEALGSHAVVDQAIGVVLALGGLTPHEGWDVLRAISQRTNIKLRSVAELLIEWVRTKELRADIRAELERQLARIPAHRQAEG